jgi:hypothetical protein
VAGPWSDSACLQVSLQQLGSGGDEPQPGVYQ